MKPCFSNFIIFIMVFLPFILLAHQNCSQIQDFELETTKAQNPVNSNHHPILLENLKLISFNENVCTKEQKKSFNDSVYFFHTKFNICAVANNQCEVFFLEDNNYSQASLGDCDPSTRLTEFNQKSVTVKSAKELGYTPNPDHFCTQALEPLVNLKTHVCVQATDGCQSQYLKSKGFLKDTFEICFY